MSTTSLSDIQRAYLAGRGMELGDVPPRYHVEAEARHLDLGRLGLAVDRLIARHDVLRATFSPDGTQTVLDVVPPLEIGVHDLRDASASARRAAVLAAREATLSRPLVPGSWPSIELRAFLMPDGVTRLHLAIDLLVMDATSMVRFNAELTRLYLDPAAELPALGLTWADVRRAEEATAGERSAAVAAALETIDAPPPPGLPLAVAPGTFEGCRFRSLRTHLTADEWAAAAAAGGARKLTPGALVTAASSAALGAWSTTPQFALTLTTHQRPAVHPQVGDVLGPFTGLTVVTVDRGGAPDMATHARAAQVATWRGLRDWRHVGVAGLGRIARRRRTRGAVSPVVLTSVLATDGPAELLGGIATPVHSVMQTPQVWLEHQVYPAADGGLVLQFNAVDGLFADGVLEDMLDAGTSLLRRLGQGPAAWSARPIVPLPAGQVRRRAAVRATGAPVPEGLLHDPFLRAADRAPEAPAVVDATRTVTYGELRDRTRDLGAELHARGARPDTLVAVVMRKGWEQVAGVLGVLESGAAYLPVDPDLPAARIAWLLENAEVEVALTTVSVDGELDWPKGVTRLRVDERPRPVDPSAVPVRARPSDLAYVIFTSGSTGTPKGVMIEHSGALNTVLDVNARIGMGPADRVLALSSLGFDLSVWDVFGTLAAGGTVVLPEAADVRDPARWADLVRRHGVTVWNSVPALMRLLTEHVRGRAPERLRTVRCALLSGDWIPVALPREIREVVPGVRVVSMGGATEASIWSVWHDVEAADGLRESIPYGRPMSNQDLTVLDSHLEERPDGVTGEIHIGGVGLARGYWRDEARTAASFVRHPRTGERLYRTGDLGRWLPEGVIEFLGREDGQVKIRGFRIELSEVELALEAHPAVGRAVALATGRPGAERRLVAHVLPEGSAPVDEGALRAHLAARLPAYMVPSAFLVLSELPLTANGKVDRAALADTDPAAVMPGTGGGGTGSAPDALTSQVARIVADVLEVDAVGPDEDLVALGVTSLEIVRIADALESVVGARPGLDVLLVATSARELAARLAPETRAPRFARTGTRCLVAMTTPAMPRQRLVCLPFAGGGPQVFRPWVGLVEDDVAVLAAQFAGRGARLGETPAASIEQMAADVLAALPRDVPFSVVGHSLGALVAFELTHRLVAAGGPLPERLVVGGAIAPGARRAAPVIHTLDDDQLVASMASFGGLPDRIRDRPDVLRVLLPSLRADLEAVEAYCPAARGPLPVPIHAFGGTEDPLVAAGQIAGWAIHTSAGCTVRMLPGDHFFIHGHGATFVAAAVTAVREAA